MSISALVRWFRALIEKIKDEDAAMPSFWIAWIRGQIFVYMYMIRDFVKERCLQQAAALTYTTLLSLVPLLAVAFSVFKAFNAFEGLDRKVEQAVFEVFLAGPFMESRDALGDAKKLEDIQTILARKAGESRDPAAAAKALEAADRQVRSSGSLDAFRDYMDALTRGADASKVRAGLSTIYFEQVPWSVLETLRNTLSPEALEAYVKAAGLDVVPGKVEPAPTGAAIKLLDEAENLRLAGRFDEAMVVAEKARKEKCPWSYILPQQAKTLASRADTVRDYPEAIGLYQQALLYLTDTLILFSPDRDQSSMESLRSDQSDYLTGLAQLHASLAKQILRKSKQTDLTTEQQHVLLQQAIDELEKASLIQDTSSDIHLELADALWRDGRRDEAQAHYVAATRTANQRVAKGFSIAIVDYLRSFIQRVNTASIGAVGVVFLIITAISLLNTIEQTFNTIWRVESRRPFWIKFTSFCTFLWLGPVMIGLSIYVREKIATVLSAAVRGEHTLSGAARVSFTVVNYVAPFVFILIVLIALYKFLPHTKVKFVHAFYGAFVTGILLQLARPLFAMYLKRAVQYQELYGSLGAVPVFLLWLWLLWVIVLLGAEISYVSQNVWTIRLHERVLRFSNRLIDRFLAVRVMTYVGRRFFRGEGPTTIEDLASRLHITEEEIGNACRRLADRKLLLPANDEHTEFVPARDMKNLSVLDIVEVNNVLRNEYRSGAAEDAPVEQTLDKLFDSMHESDKAVLKDMSLYALVSTLPDETAAPAPADQT